jgi:hypothetical protein
MGQFLRDCLAKVIGIPQNNARSSIQLFYSPQGTLMQRTSSFLWASALSLLAVASAPAWAEGEVAPAASVAAPAVAPGTIGHIQKAQAVKRDKALVYKQTLADGRVVYGDEPLKGRPVEKVIEVDLRSTATWAAKTDMGKDSPTLPTPTWDGADPKLVAAAEQKAVNAADQKAASKLAQSSDERAKATARLLVAEERFARANEALAQAQNPTGTDRQMNANGTSRISMDFFERLEKAQTAANQAALEYDAALSAARYFR